MVIAVPSDVIFTVFGLRPRTWLIILAIVIVVLITRAILKRMKETSVFKEDVIKKPGPAGTKEEEKDD